MNSINRYLIKNFLIRFFQVTCGFSLLIFFINFIDSMDKIGSTQSGGIFVGAMMAFLQIPSFLNDIASSLVLIATILTFFTLSSKNEITIIRISGFSLWQIIRPVTICAASLGIFWITIFDLISIKMTKEFNRLESKYVENEMREAFAPQGGIWLKQSNLEKRDEEMVLLAQKVYQDNLEFGGVTIWFFNDKGEFYKKIDAEKIFLKNKFWKLQNITINDSLSINSKFDTMLLPTDLEADFVIQKIVNNFQNVKIFSIFELPKLIKDLTSSGFESTKFKIYFHSLLAKPILFSAMGLIACYFSLNHIRNQNTAFLILCGMVMGLILYITSGIINALGSSSLIPIFASTWLIAIICFAIGTLLIYQKEPF